MRRRDAVLSVLFAMDAIEASIINWPGGIRDADLEGEFLRYNGSTKVSMIKSRVGRRIAVYN